MKEPEKEFIITLSCFNCNSVASKTITSSEWKSRSFGCKKCLQCVEMFTPVLYIGESYSLDFFIIANMSIRFYRKT